MLAPTPPALTKTGAAAVGRQLDVLSCLVRAYTARGALERKAFSPAHIHRLKKELGESRKWVVFQGRAGPDQLHSSVDDMNSLLCDYLEFLYSIKASLTRGRHAILAIQVSVRSFKGQLRPPWVGCVLGKWISPSLCVHHGPSCLLLLCLLPPYARPRYGTHHML